MIFKCKMCGGTIEFKLGDTVGVCDSCGTKQTLPRLDDEKKANLYDRANHFRRNNDFDKAMAIYEQILNEDSTDAEAYWSLVLCRYGIEYVEDPTSHKRVPTVNRAQFTSIFADEDYKSALRYADGYQKQIYEEEAKVIDEIQKGILEISSKEEPFDVFICYKETDSNGKRTQDSVIANDLYYELTEEGFKVFFSRITLEDKLGTAYEPYIFAALNSAKVMVVVGTKPEYFNAVWVKNEWSRYLALIKNGAKKMLIPAYRDMDPYDLPEEFSHLQAQDMSKLGFMQDIIRGIKKIIGVTAQKQMTQETIVGNNATSANILPLLERVFLFLEDSRWQDANIYCEKVLDINPKSAEAYLGKLMAELGVRIRNKLADCKQPFDNNENYLKVIRFGDEKLENEMRGYIAHINERNENDRLKAAYNHAVSIMQTAKTENGFRIAANEFHNISGFKDSDVLEKECIDKAEICRKDDRYNFAKSKMCGDNIGDYQLALKTFESIPDWKDTNEQICICKKEIEQINIKEENKRLQAACEAEEKRIAAEKAKERLLAAEKAAKKRKKIKEVILDTIVYSIIIAAIVFWSVWAKSCIPLIVLVCIAIPFVLIRIIHGFIWGGKYRKAMRNYNAGNIVNAYESLIALRKYKDSEEKAKSIYDKYKIEKLKVANIGDSVLFGAYMQDNYTSNGKEDIRWLVLAKNDDKILVVSEKVLDCRQYHTSRINVAWETCSLRSWLNGSFFNSAFNTEEQLRVKDTNVSADKIPKYGTVGRDTTDRIFLLSITEANKYFDSNKARRCVPTAYTKAIGVYTENRFTKGGQETCTWWLRSSGCVQQNAAIVTLVGSVVDFSVSDKSGVRPAMWLKIGSVV